MDDEQVESKFAPGTPERALADHLDAEGFGYWVNTDDVVDEVRKTGWAPVDGSADSEPCEHDSETGDEGPMSELGRWPVRWKCDGCGRIRVEEPVDHESEVDRG
jgi:hypothetical protein